MRNTIYSVVWFIKISSLNQIIRMSVLSTKDSIGHVKQM